MSHRFNCLLLIVSVTFLSSFTVSGRAGFSSPSGPGGESRGTEAQADSRLTKAHVSTSYGRLPIAFERNAGQVDKSVRYVARGRGYALFLTANEVVFSIRKSEETESSVIRMRLVSSNRGPIEGMDELSGKVNYFIGNDPAKWRTNVPTFARVRYHAVYP
ncbi:MAG: hypothetical protein ACRD1T_20125, partial [Acidimicrobiia bacterium]